MKTWSTKSDPSVFDHVHYTAIWRKNMQRKGEKMNYSVKGRKERGGEKKRLTLTLVFILFLAKKKTRLHRFALKTVKISINLVFMNE